jgi:23S rRNA pseudouridine2605 synthase
MYHRKSTNTGQTKAPVKTLERVFSRLGIGSRTEARSWIGNGRVRVNGRIVRNPDQWVNLDSDRIELDGKPLRAARKRYLVLYKPRGYLTTYKDPEGRPTVYDLLGDNPDWVVPVGRLDLDTSGLILLTNDTRFAEAVTNPVRHVPKTYLVKASTLLTGAQLEQLRQGVQLSDGPTRPAQVVRVRDSEKYTFLEITITEGRNRQVRRMLEAVDSKVLKLVRIAIGTLRIGDLKIGSWRELSPDERRALAPKAR